VFAKMETMNSSRATVSPAAAVRTLTGSSVTGPQVCAPPPAPGRPLSTLAGSLPRFCGCVPRPVPGKLAAAARLCPTLCVLPEGQVPPVLADNRPVHAWSCLSGQLRCGALHASHSYSRPVHGVEVCPWCGHLRFPLLHGEHV
jgi:hypothetical protein